MQGYSVTWRSSAHRDATRCSAPTIPKNPVANGIRSTASKPVAELGSSEWEGEPASGGLMASSTFGTYTVSVESNERTCAMIVRVGSGSPSNNLPWSAAHKGLSEMRRSAFAGSTSINETVNPTLISAMMHDAMHSSHGLRSMPATKAEQLQAWKERHSNQVSAARTDDSEVYGACYIVVRDTPCCMLQ